MMTKLCKLGTLLLLFSCLAGAAAQDKHMLWQVSADGQQGYLFGSIHMGNEAMYPLEAAIDEAFAQSGALVVELDILAVDPMQAAQLMLSKGMYPDTEVNLKSELDPATWQRVVEVGERYGLPSEFLQQHKPWLLMLTLSIRVFQEAGYREDLGIDRHFLQRAKHRGMPIISLETAEQQLRPFEQLSAREQIGLLKQTLDELDQGEAFLAKLVGAWRTGDSARIDELMNESLQASAATRRAYDLLLVQRNRAMAERIETILRDGLTPFVVIGAAHLAGEDSIVELLRARGYRVQQR